MLKKTAAIPEQKEAGKLVPGLDVVKHRLVLPSVTLSMIKLLTIPI